MQTVTKKIMGGYVTTDKTGTMSKKLIYGKERRHYILIKTPI